MFGTFDGEIFKGEAVPVGTSYSITDALTGDAGVAQYTPSAVVKYGEQTYNTKGTMGSDLILQSTDVNIVTETKDANSVSFTNTYSSITPTGLFIDNLPYILMIALPGMVLALYFGNKKRKHQQA
ncbi:hypothetical protein [Eubacterium aggregans]|uniref:hypothetical protein n=1 Tax=Eubacterium aggregans TaxID=81409 RepID=UPI003F2F6269